MRELLEKRSPVAASLPAPDLVRAVLLEPSHRVAFRKPLAPGSEVPQENVYTLFFVIAPPPLYKSKLTRTSYIRMINMTHLMGQS